MQNIFLEGEKAVASGSTFTVDFKSRTLRLGKNEMINPDTLKEDFGIDRKLSSEAISDIEKLYQKYKFSIPSERSEKRRRNYFKALPEEQLPDESFMYGIPRETARYRLEATLLVYILNGSIKWNDLTDEKHWFWKSQSDGNLVILREWIQNNPITK